MQPQPQPQPKPTGVTLTANASVRLVPAEGEDLAPYLAAYPPWCAPSWCTAYTRACGRTTTVCSARLTIVPVARKAH